MVNPLWRLPYAGQPLSVNGRQTINLTGGAAYLLPAGDFFIRTGRQVVVEYYDSRDGHWNAVCVPGAINSPFYVGSDGTNYRVRNVSGSVQGVYLTNNGSGYTAAPTVTITAPDTPGITATGVAIVGGDLTFSIVAGGTGYTFPEVLIDPPGPNNGNAVPATGYATLSAAGGSITAITLVAGCGYLTAPNVTIVDPAGTGASAVATIGTTNASKVLAVRMTNNGSAYTGTNIPTVTISGAGGSAATGTAIMSFALTSVTVGYVGASYSQTPIIMSGGAVVVSKLDAAEPLPFRQAVATPTVGSGTISAVTIDDEGFGLQKVPALAVLPVNAATPVAGSTATLTAVVGGVSSYVSIWQLG